MSVCIHVHVLVHAQASTHTDSVCVCNADYTSVNPLPTNDAPMRHDLSEFLTLHKLMGIYMGGLILCAILQYMVSAYFSCFFMVGKGLSTYMYVNHSTFAISQGWYQDCAEWGCDGLWLNVHSVFCYGLRFSDVRKAARKCLFLAPSQYQHMDGVTEMPSCMVETLQVNLPPLTSTSSLVPTDSSSNMYTHRLT